MIRSGSLNAVAGLSDDDRAMIRGGNASRLLGLPVERT
jgi:hypothetical protein